MGKDMPAQYRKLNNYNRRKNFVKQFFAYYIRSAPLFMQGAVKKRLRYIHCLDDLDHQVLSRVDALLGKAGKSEIHHNGRGAV